MNEGERIVAMILGSIFCLAAVLGFGNALWYQQGSEAVLLGTLAISTGWLARISYYGNED